MAQTLQNLVQVPTNPDSFANFTADLATMGNSIFALIPVANQAARDALTKKNGLAVLRLDLGLVEWTDGTSWFRNPDKNVFNTTDTNWSWNGGIMKTAVPGLTQFTASAAMNRVAGGTFTVSTSDTNMGNFVPSGYRPAVTAYLVVSVTNGGAVVGQAQLAITTTGDFILRTFSGSFTFPSAGSMYINGSWMG